MVKAEVVFLIAMLIGGFGDWVLGSASETNVVLVTDTTEIGREQFYVILRTC